LTKAAWYSTSVAAGMALMFGIWNGFQEEKTPVSLETALVITPVEQKETNFPIESQTQKLASPSQENNIALVTSVRNNQKREHIKPMQPARITVNQEVAKGVEKVHGESVDWSYALASAYEPEFDMVEPISVETQEKSPLISKKGGFIQFAQWGLSKLSRNPERFKIETEYNEKNELTHFALQTPNFGFERKRK
jgi:hypothetical protein